MDETARQEALANMPPDMRRRVRAGHVPALISLADRMPSVLPVVRFLVLDESIGGIVSPYAVHERGWTHHHDAVDTAFCDMTSRLHAPGEPSPGRNCDCGIYATTPASRDRIERRLFDVHGSVLVTVTGRLAGPIYTDPTDPDSLRGHSFTAHRATVFTVETANSLRAAPGGWADIPVTVTTRRPATTTLRPPLERWKPRPNPRRTQTLSGRAQDPYAVQDRIARRHREGNQ